MHFKNEVEVRLQQFYILNLFSVFENSGLNHELFTLSVDVVRYKISYSKNKSYYFEFWWATPGMKEVISYDMLPLFNNNMLEGGTNWATILDLVKTWLLTIKTKQDNDAKFKQITMESNYDETIGVEIEDKCFNAKELESLKDKISELEKTLFTTTGLTLEAIEDLKKMVKDILTTASNTENSKKSVEEVIIGKVFVMAKQHAGDSVFNYVSGQTLKEILSIFSGYKGNQLPPLFQHLIG